MRIFDFSPAGSTPIDHFGSQGARMLRVLETGGPLSVGSLYLEPNGRLGEHETKSDQLLLVVQGRATVMGGDGETASATAGQAVFWQAGELHETCAGHEGLAAIVIEGEKLEPDKFLRRMLLP